jgi:hypothetical protein
LLAEDGAPPGCGHFHVFDAAAANVPITTLSL